MTEVLEKILAVTAVDWNVKTWSLRRPVLFLEVKWSDEKSSTCSARRS